VSNIYFLITAILQSIPQISPLQPFTAIAPLVFVLGVSMIRDGFEDYLRYKSDREINNSPTTVYKQGSLQEIKFESIRVGDLVLVKKDQTFPCDIIMLATSNENGTAYIETSTLDGEKALKPRNAFIHTSLLLSRDGINRVANKINCENPNSNLYNFKGNFEFFSDLKSSEKKDYKGNLYPLEKNHLLLAGAFLRNTEWILGIAVYTGVDTKLRMNMSKRRYKESQIEHKTNRYIVVIIVLQFCLCLVCAVASGSWVSSNMNEHDYIRYDKDYDIYDKGGPQGVLSYFTYFLLLNTMLPISLIVSLELLKLGQGFFMMFDKEMYSDRRDRCCKVSSFSLNEELGMIKHIFSDKTGTLTCNQMEFKFLCAGNRIYGEQSVLVNIGLKTKVTYEDREIKYTFYDKNIENDLFAEDVIDLNFPIIMGKNEFTNQKDITYMALRGMALCHECIIEEDEGEIKYTGPSPDDVVLVDSAKRIGFKLANIKSEVMTLEIHSRLTGERFEETYKRICIIEFTSDRKRMSVIFQNQKTSEYLIFMKGADNVVLNCLAKPDDPEAKRNIDKYINKIKSYGTQFSSRGFRVLLMAFKYISKKDFKKWKKEYDLASTDIDNRDEKIAAAAEIIEKDLFLIGCTAVEDALQDDVPDTINDLLKAGISFWMLTGDKYETAENIGKTCTLIDDNMHVESCRVVTEKECFEKLSSAYNSMMKVREEKQSALIIEGASLKIVLGKPRDQSQDAGATLTEDQKEEFCLQARNEFLKISDICKTVICCRMSPSDKKDVVSLVKNHCKAVTLSIGDGANDVPMILEAHIGVGLYGEEGIQAVQASDYALGEFRYLWELLLVHGRFNYIRQSEMILYFFYKNLVFTLPQFLFSHFCAYSGQTVYDDWYLTFYNLVFTALPLFMRALFEKDYDVPKRWEISGNSTDDKKKIIREHIPLVYVVGQKNQLFTLSRFLLWLSNGVLHAVIIFFIPLYAAEEGIMNEDGHNFDQWSFSIASFTSIILIVNFKLGINTKLWNRFHFACMFGLSIVLYFVFILIYDVVTYTSSFHTVYALLNSHYYYFCIIANVFLVVCIDGACTVMTKVIAPTQSDTMARFALNVENNEYDENSKKHNKDNLSSEFHEQDVKPSKRKPYKVQGKVFDSGDENLEKNEIENRA
jgi:phospholipid-transporting ATPase